MRRDGGGAALDSDDLVGAARDAAPRRPQRLGLRARLPIALRSRGRRLLLLRLLRMRGAGRGTGSHRGARAAIATIATSGGSSAGLGGSAIAAVVVATRAVEACATTTQPRRIVRAVGGVGGGVAEGKRRVVEKAALVHVHVVVVVADSRAGHAGRSAGRGPNADASAGRPFAALRLRRATRAAAPTPMTSLLVTLLACECVRALVRAVLHILILPMSDTRGLVARSAVRARRARRRLFVPAGRPARRPLPPPPSPAPVSVRRDLLCVAARIDAVALALALVAAVPTAATAAALVPTVAAPSMVVAARTLVVVIVPEVVNGAIMKPLRPTATLAVGHERDLP